MKSLRLVGAFKQDLKRITRRGYDRERLDLIVQALLITALVIVVRFAWIFPVATLDQKLRARKDPDAEPVGWRERTIAS